MSDKFKNKSRGCQRDTIMNPYKKHKDNIKKQDKKYPLVAYFLSNKSIKDCSKECKKQLQELKK